MMIHEDTWLKLLITLIRLAVAIFTPRPGDDVETKADGPANEIEVEIDP